MALPAQSCRTIKRFRRQGKCRNDEKGGGGVAVCRPGERRDPITPGIGWCERHLLHPAWVGSLRKKPSFSGCASWRRPGMTKINAMGIKDTTPPSRDMMRPSSASVIRPKKIEGAGKTGCALHPRSRVQSVERDAHEHTGSAEAVRPSLRNGFNGFLRALLATGFLSPSSPKKLASQKLDASIGASGPHDFAVHLTRCSSKAHRRPPHPIPTFVTMANAPS